MAITFQRAPTVAVGEAITSTQLSKLALAFNDRLRSGIADGDWRITFYLLSLFKQVRNPDASGYLFPSLGEFFTEYQAIKPTDGEWPATPPGEPEGANLSSLAPVFVHGSDSTGLFPEATRMSDVPIVLASASDGVIWENTKLQRGAVDIATGLISSASWDAARTAYYIRSSNQSPHGNSYGGYQPLFHLNGDCGDGDTDIQATPKYDIKFTNLNDSTTLTYDSCLVGYVEGPEAYYVFEASGVTVLPYSTWIAGPKTEGASLTKRFGNHLPRILNAWVQTFRGTPEQAGQRIGTRTPDWQDFFTSYYHLAPCRGFLANAEDNIIEAVYPLFATTTAKAAGDTLHCNTSSQSFYPVNESFVVTSCYISGTNHNDTAVSILSDGIVIASATLGAGQAGRIVSLLATPVAAGSVVSVKLTSALTFRGAGSFSVELAETYAYKPGVHDAYLLTRLGAAKESADLTGSSFTEAKQLGQDYFSKCGVVGRNDDTLPAAEDATNQNAVFESARQLSKHVRFIKRQLLRKYAVVNGKSVLWFNPTNTVSGVSTNPWEAIAGLIAPAAAAQGWTNEWLLRVNFRAYQNSYSSIWKPDSYSDYFPLVERCQFYNRQLFDLGKADLVSHFNYGDKFSLAPEAPPGYRYAGGSNNNAYRSASSGDLSNFFKSCQVYSAPYEIETAEYDTDGLVKVTLKTRMQSESTAPSSVSSDVSSWSLTDIRAEAYRTDENGLREYLFHQYNGTDCDREKIGDGALETEVWTDHSGVRGTCYPMFTLTKLVPLPYDDGNDKQNSVDTKVIVDQFTQMELYIRAMCEGYIDGQTTNYLACSLASPAYFDFSYEAMCYEAFGGRSFSFMPISDRSDRPTGFGPIPNTLMTAQIFNQFSSAINLLTSARVMLPLVLNSNRKTFKRIGDALSVSQYDGPAIGAPENTTKFYVSETGVRSIGPSSFAVNAQNGFDDTSPTPLYSTKDVEFLEVGDGGAGSLEAIPLAWRDMMTSASGLIMLASRTDTTVTLTHGAIPSCASATTSTVIVTSCVHFSGPTLEANPPPTRIATYQGSGAGSPCVGGNNTTVQIDITSDDAFAVTIPLTAE